MPGEAVKMCSPEPVTTTWFAHGLPEGRRISCSVTAGSERRTVSAVTAEASHVNWRSGSPAIAAAGASVPTGAVPPDDDEAAAAAPDDDEAAAAAPDDEAAAPPDDE